MTTEQKNEMTLKEKRDRLSEIKSQRKELISQLRDLNNKRNDVRKVRDDLNLKAKELFQAVKENRIKRDQINEEVSLKKQMRDILREDADKIGKRLLELSSKMKGEHSNPGKYRHVGERIKSLERNLETTAYLSKDQEKQTLKQLEELSSEFEKLEIFRELRSEFRDIQQKLRQMQTEIKTYHTSLVTLAQESQIHQEKMIEATKEAKKVKEEADASHAEVIALSSKLKDIRTSLDSITQEVKNLSSEFVSESSAAKKAKRAEVKKIRDQKLDEKAEEILTRYKDGNTLTLDEFKVLMERGLI